MSDDNGLMASIIVVGYNDMKYLEGCMSSLLDQDMPAEEYEVIYADDASPDGSADFVAERFPAVRVVRLDRNYGFAEGNNRAATFARGRYIAFQNADTVAHRRWLPELIKAMRDDPQVKGCHPAGSFCGPLFRAEASPSGGPASGSLSGSVSLTEESPQLRT